MIVSDEVENYKLHKLFESVQGAAVEWDGAPDYIRPTARTLFSARFYQGIYGMKHNFSGYTSREAFMGHKRNNTEDHFLSARLVFRAMMDQCREILTDFEKFSQLVRDCQTTVRVTKDQNNTFDIKFRMDGDDPVIRALTIEKYDGWGWYQDGKGFLTEYVNGELVPKKFPLKHMVPDWLTEFEKKYVK